MLKRAPAAPVSKRVPPPVKVMLTEKEGLVAFPRAVRVLVPKFKSPARSRLRLKVLFACRVTVIPDPIIISRISSLPRY